MKNRTPERPCPSRLLIGAESFGCDKTVEDHLREHFGRFPSDQLPPVLRHYHVEPSPHTVHRHVANVRTKLGQSSRAAAVAEAVRLGLL